MKIIGIIPARYDSQRFPGKPLIDIAGKTMIQRVYEQAKKCSLLDEVLVATDDTRIFEHCKHQEIHVVMTSKKHESGTDRCAEALQKCVENYDIVVNIQGDEPLIQPQQIEELLVAFNHPEVQIATLVRAIQEKKTIQNSNVVKTVFTKNNKALYFSRSPIPYCRNANLKPTAYQHIGMYGFKTNVLLELVKIPMSDLEKMEQLEQLRWLENDYEIYVNETNFPTIAIDTPEDLEELMKLIV